VSVLVAVSVYNDAEGNDARAESESLLIQLYDPQGDDDPDLLGLSLATDGYESLDGFEVSVHVAGTQGGEAEGIANITGGLQETGDHFEFAVPLSVIQFPDVASNNRIIIDSDSGREEFMHDVDGMEEARLLD